MTNQSGDATNRGDAMSDIERFDIRCLAVNKRENGEWVRYDDHRAEVERLTAERDEAQAEVERLKEQVAALTVAVKQADEMKAHAEATAAAEEAETDRVISERDAAQVEVYRLENAIDHLTSERDEAQAERDAAQRERERVQALLWVRERELPTLQGDQSAQNLDMANGQAILDSSRPTDEDIWREVFVRSVNTPSEFKVAFANWALAEYRKRWPR